MRLFVAQHRGGMTRRPRVLTRPSSLFLQSAIRSYSRTGSNWLLEKISRIVQQPFYPDAAMESACDESEGDRPCLGQSAQRGGFGEVFREGARLGASYLVLGWRFNPHRRDT